MYTVIAMKYTFNLVFCLCMLLLMGCPSKIHHLESIYFENNYIETTILANKLSSKNKSKIKTFLKQNNDSLQHQLLNSLNTIIESPTIESIKPLPLFSISISQLQSQFPKLITKEFEQNIQHKVQLAYTSYKKLIEAQSPELIEDHHYRTIHSALNDVKTYIQISPSQNQILKKLDMYLPRFLYLNTIHIIDKPIKDLITSSNKTRPSLYKFRGTHRIVDTVNVPLTLKKRLLHQLHKEASKYLTIQDNATTPHYTLNCSVEILKNESLVEEKKEITNVFAVRFEQDNTWYNKELIYEVFTHNKTYTASVDADLYLTKTQNLIGRFVFETIVKFETHRIGEIINTDPTIVEISHSSEYKSYQAMAFENKQEFYIKQALNDAAKILTHKILNTIDTDPDPYSAAFPLHLQ